MSITKNYFRKLNRADISFILKNLNINANATEGWVTVKSPLRDDKTPSFGINVETGSWKDHATNEHGSIIDLIKEVKGFQDNIEVKKWLDDLLNRKTSNVNEYSGSSFEIDDSFKDPIDRIPDIPLSEIANRKGSFEEPSYIEISEYEDSELIEQILDHDGLKPSTLEIFNCKLTSDYGDLELVMPYPTGGQRYNRVNGEKHIRQLDGSKPTESFFGIQNHEAKETLIIAKSPREAMLVDQELGDKYAVIGLCGAESSKLTVSQQSIIKELRGVHETVITILDCDTDKAHDIAKGLAKNIKSITRDHCDVKYLNIHDISNGKHKDLADLYRDKRKLSLDLVKACEVKEQPVINSKDRFWNSKGKINNARLLEFLEREGLFKRYTGTDYVSYRDDGTFIYEVSEHQIRDHVREYLDAIPREVLSEDLKNEVVSRLITMNASNLLHSAKNKEHLNLSKDGKEFSLLFYKDVYIKVTQNGVEYFKYTELKGSTWHSELIPRSAPKNVTNSRGEYEEFIEMATGNDAKRKRSAMQCIGYMLHRFKNKAVVKAVILTDEKIGENNTSNGGTGKTIFAKSLEHIRPIHTIPGKQFDSGHRFAFMDYQEKYRIILIDDVRENFDFTGLFTVITGELPVERKHENRTTIPFDRSPKIILTSNDPILGKGDSFRRRQFILEFASTFNSRFTPLEHFGHLLFDDWDEQEWYKFDSFMIRCLQEYLKNGLNQVLVNYGLRQIITETTQSFFEWAEEYLELNVEYDQRRLFRGLSETKVTYDEGSVKPKNSKGEYFPSFRMIDSKALLDSQIRTFKTYLEKYCEYKGWLMNSRNTDGNTLIWFVKVEEEEEEDK
ncbi:hypothetical protein ACKGJO_00865 [Gracilimonas sp. Q87]|uniref:primase-helicase family protein n=1 Tax=Gracilimonas sp. Q87 TaxID=3384766 RepID=UPI003983FA2B